MNLTSNSGIIIYDFLFLYPYECFYTSIIYIRINCYNHFDTEKKKCKDTVFFMGKIFLVKYGNAY